MENVLPMSEDDIPAGFNEDGHYAAKLIDSSGYVHLGMWSAVDGDRIKNIKNEIEKLNAEMERYLLNIQWMKDADGYMNYFVSTD
jgi:hypothetical protein